MRAPHFLTAVAWALASACVDSDETPEAADPLVTFRTSTVCLLADSQVVRMPVEIAETDDQRAYGLMERSSLARDAGMLFTYEDVQPAESGYWMYNTLIPLEIAYIDSAGVIRAIQRMEPCTSINPRFCPTYPAGVEFSAALEVNPGFFQERGITSGSRMVLVGDDACPTE